MSGIILPILADIFTTFQAWGIDWPYSTVYAFEYLISVNLLSLLFNYCYVTFLFTEDESRDWTQNFLVESN